MKPKELEKRLEAARRAGYFDGYCASINAIHKDWEAGLAATRGIGPKLTARIMKEMHVYYEERTKKAPS